MLQVDRQERLLAYINQHRKATIDELTQVLNVSKATIRRDIDELDSRKLLYKTYGGVVSLYNSLSGEISSDAKSTQCIEEKQRIGKKAAELVEDGDIIILDAGTTTLEIAKNLGDRVATVITNDLKIATELTRFPHITLYMVGGLVEHTVSQTVGHVALRFLKTLNVNKTFLGVDAINLTAGITDRAMEDVPIKQEMAACANDLIVVADHTKIGQEMFATVGLLEQIKIIITDQISDNLREQFEKTGLNIEIV